MRVLLLGPPRPDLEGYLLRQGVEVVRTEEPPFASGGCWHQSDWVISYGYRHIVPREILKRFEGRAINLHISFLPWNRGADPNLWSFLEDTPKGVTIHQIDEGLDTGPILAQETVPMGPEDTLRVSYHRLTEAIEALFMKTWPRILSGSVRGRPQPQGGSFHRSKDKEPFLFLLRQGWDTPTRDLLGRALRARGRKRA